MGVHLLFHDRCCRPELDRVTSRRRDFERGTRVPERMRFSGCLCSPLLHQALLWTGSLRHPHFHDDGGCHHDASLSGSPAQMVHVTGNYYDMGLCDHGEILVTSLWRCVLQPGWRPRTRHMPADWRSAGCTWPDGSVRLVGSCLPGIPQHGDGDYYPKVLQSAALPEEDSHDRQCRWQRRRASQQGNRRPPRLWQSWDGRGDFRYWHTSEGKGRREVYL